MSGGEPSVCRLCGDRGYEDADDQARLLAGPEVCPACFEGLLQHETIALINDRLRAGRTIRSCLDRSMSRLRRAGLTERAVVAARGFLEAALAHDLAEEGRAN